MNNRERWINICYLTGLMVFIHSCAQDPAFVSKDPDVLDVIVGKQIDEGKLGEKLGEFSSEYDATEFAEGQLNYDLSSQTYSQSIVMTGNYQAQTASFTQVTREEVSDNHTQGSTGQNNTETFIQDAPDRDLDILVIIDNSGSMIEEQQNLSTKLDPLLSYISDTNWKMSFTTTDPNNGCQVNNGLLTKDDSNIHQKFSNLVMQGINGSGNERGIQQLVRGLSMSCAGSSPWVRPNSHVAVLIVTDEDNCSNGAGCGASAWNTELYAYNYLNSIRVPGANARFYGLIWIPGTTCSSGYNVGHQYNNLATMTNGKVGSICSNDYSNTLAQISADINQSLNTSFTLAHTPNSGTLNVFINNVLRTTGYTLTNNVVEFTSNVPVAGSQIRFEYQYGGTALKTSFALSQTPAPQTIKVFVNNLLQNSGYSYHAGSNSVVFSQAPAQAASIKIDYKKSTPALITNFTLPHSNAESIVVKVNNQIVNPNSYNYNPNTAVLSFNQAPTDSASIVVNYNQFIGPKLSYAAALADWVVSSMVVKDTYGASVNYSYANAQISFPANEWANGRIVILSSTSVNPDFAAIPLSSSVLGDTVEVSYNGQVCTQQNGLIVDVSNNVIVAGCGFNLSNPNAPLEIDYVYVTKHLQEFNLDPNIQAHPAPIRVWEVMVDTSLSTEYTVNSNKLKFNAPLPIGAKVKVKVFLHEGK